MFADYVDDMICKLQSLKLGCCLRNWNRWPTRCLFCAYHIVFYLKSSHVAYLSSSEMPYRPPMATQTQRPWWPWLYS